MMTSQNGLFVMCSTNPKNGEFETSSPISVNPVGGGGGGRGKGGGGERK